MAVWNALLTLPGVYVPYQVKQYYDHFQKVAPTQPEFMPEFQGESLRDGRKQKTVPRSNSFHFQAVLITRGADHRAAA
jgi:hypothetical protein